MLSLSPVFSYCLFYFHCFLMVVSLLSSFTRSSWNEITELPIPKTPYYSSNISLHDYKACPHPLLSFILSQWLTIDLFYLFALSRKSIPPGLFITLFLFHSLALFSSMSSSCPRLCPPTTATERHCILFCFPIWWCLYKNSPCYFTLV